MSVSFEEDVVQLNLAERPALEELMTYPIGNATVPTEQRAKPADSVSLNFVEDVVRLDDVASALAPDSFKSIMTRGTGSLQALVNSSQSIQDSIDAHSHVIDRVMGHHGGLKNFIPSALFESPQHLVASITGDVSLAGLFRAQAVALGVYPAQALPERAKNLRDFEIEPTGFR